MVEVLAVLICNPPVVVDFVRSFVLWIAWSDEQLRQLQHTNPSVKGCRQSASLLINSCAWWTIYSQSEGEKTKVNSADAGNNQLFSSFSVV